MNIIATFDDKPFFFENASDEIIHALLNAKRVFTGYDGSYSLLTGRSPKVEIIANPPTKTKNE